MFETQAGMEAALTVFLLVVGIVTFFYGLHRLERWTVNRSIRKWKRDRMKGNTSW